MRQFNVLLENRVGALLELVRRFEITDIRIVSLSIVDLADCSVTRMVLSDPERAYEVLARAELHFTESDLLVVQLPDSNHPLLAITKALLAVEINIHYAYPLLIGPQGSPALALHVEDHETAVNTLTKQGFTIFSESDLGQ